MKIRLQITLILIGLLALSLTACDAIVPVGKGEDPTPTPDFTQTLVALEQVLEATEPPPEPTATATVEAPADPPPAEEPAATAAPTQAAAPTDTPVPPAPTTSPADGPIMATETTTPLMFQADADQFMAVYLDDAPQIDGDINDWPGTVYALGQVVYGSEFYANQADLFGEFKASWDNEYLYLGVLVRDTQFAQTASGAQLFNGDSIELLLDTDLAGDMGTDDLNADDYQLGFSPGNLVGAGTLPEAYLWAPTDREGPLDAALVDARLTDDGWMIEIAIPWETLGGVPAAETVMGILVSVSDNDAVGQNAQHSVVTFQSERKLTDPTSWAPLLLTNP